jgi:pyruvate ferredoxin oxidoreductase gamma subunit
MYRIRIHGRAGQGIRTAARVLATAFFREGYKAQESRCDDAQWRGAPMTAHLQATARSVLDHRVIDSPDLVIVVDETLLALPGSGTLSSLSRQTVLLVCSRLRGEALRPLLRVPSRVVVLDPADAQTSASLMAMRSLGAAMRLLGVISRPTLERAVREELAKLGEEAVRENVRQALSGFDAMADDELSVLPESPAEGDDYQSIAGGAS